jgi:aspartate/methionine/tyrosine aminotransferase
VALESERLGYTEALGLPRLRERIARYMTERYGVAIAPERVVVTSGSSAGFVLAFLLLLDSGDALGLPSPGYPCYRQILKALSVSPLLVETSGRGRWMPTIADVERLAAAGAVGLLLASPNNPTGTMALEPRLAEIADACRRHGLWLISDEIYHGLEYEAPAETALAHSADAIVVNSFSKYFSMTGWRIGWLVVPEALVRPIERLTQNLYISPSAISQIAALGAFDGIEELEEIKGRYARNRAMLLEELPRAGLSSILPADVLSLHRCEPLHLRQRSFRQGHAQGDWRRGHAGRRFRSRARLELSQVLLCGTGGRDARSSAPSRSLASEEVSRPRASAATTLCGAAPRARLGLPPESCR